MLALQMRTGWASVDVVSSGAALVGAPAAQALLTKFQVAQVAADPALTPAAALRLPVLPSPTCRAHGCEYQPLCHPSP